MASLSTLSDRLRSEIGDIGRTFVETFIGDGSTKRFQIASAPVLGSGLIVKSGSTTVSNTTIVEEQNGMIQLAVAPSDGVVVTVTGTTFRYFTNVEIEYYVNSAFLEHAHSTTDSNGSRATLTTLPVLDEYPLVLLASTMALYTLATDASFDIDIISPDGVSIPRSERFRQLSEVITARKEQYRELCNLLGIGLYKIDVTTLRRVSRLTNRYIPIYRPQEIEDSGLPQRVRLPIPDYGDVTPESEVVTRDLSMYSGDNFSLAVKFSINLSTYTPKSQIRLFPTSGSSQVGPIILASFTITKSASISGGVLDTLNLSLTGAVTETLPRTAYYDLQLTDSAGLVRTYFRGKVFTDSQVTI